MSTMTKKAPANKAKKAAPVVSLALALDHVVYQVEPITGIQIPEIARAFRLIKTTDDAVYDVCRTVDGLVTCDCPSYVNTFAGTCDTCKHGKALVQLGLLDAPAWCPPAQAESRPGIDRVRDEFDAPEVAPAPAPIKTNALAWAVAITGKLWDVATADQRAFAVELLNRDYLTGVTITPVGPSIEELEAMLAATKPAPAPCCAPAEAEPCKACEPEPEFVIPAEVDPLYWSAEILGDLRTVAPAEAIRYAETIRAEEWQFAGLMIRPMFPSLDELRAKLPSAAVAVEVEPTPAPISADEPIGWEPRPRPARAIAAASPRPVRLAPLPEASYTLAELIDGQAALLRGQGGPAFHLMARRLEALAADVRMVGASSVEEYEAKLVI